VRAGSAVVNAGRDIIKVLQIGKESTYRGR
jgi:hypothetical protein